MKLKEARLARGLGRPALAKMLAGAGAGIDMPTIWRYETGRVKPGIENARKLADALNVPVESIDEFQKAVADEAKNQDLNRAVEEARMQLAQQDTALRVAAQESGNVTQ